MQMLSMMGILWAFSSSGSSGLDVTILQPGKIFAQMVKYRIRFPIPCENGRG